MTTIYVVYGQTGEYSDHTEWLVCAYEDKVKAERHADLAAARAKAWLDETCEHGITRRHGCSTCQWWRWSTSAFQAHMEALDPLAQVEGYVGTDYVALPVEVRTEVPGE